MTAMARRGGGTGAGQALIGLTMLVLVVELLLGLWIYLYDKALPASLPDAFRNASSTPALSAHIGLALLLGVLALGVLVWAVVRHHPRVVLWGFLGLIGVLLAGVGGEEFLMTGHDGFSLVMVLGFLVAFGAYFRAARVLARRRAMPPPLTPVAMNPP